MRGKGLASAAVVSIAAAIGLLLGSGTAWAGGAWVYETAAPDVGTASAGRAALAEDASTTFGNPAGMTRLGGVNLLFGLQPTIITTESDTGTRTPPSATDGANAGGFPPAGRLYGNYSIQP